MHGNTPITLGARHGYGGDTPFSFTLADRRHHTHLIGKTGTGKSTLLLNTVCEDIRAGRGIGVIDPHGPLAAEALDCVQKSGAEDVVYFNPSDTDYPISWNLLKAEHPERKHLVASGIVAAFKSILRESWALALNIFSTRLWRLPLPSSTNFPLRARCPQFASVFGDIGSHLAAYSRNSFVYTCLGNLSIKHLRLYSEGSIF